MHMTGYPRHKENRENGQKNIPISENTGNLEILFAQVLNSLILKVKEIAICRENFQKPFCVCNSHK